MYRCPVRFGTISFLGGLAFGGGEWAFYGCQGQLTPQSSCLEIEYPFVRDVSCRFEGNLRVAKVAVNEPYDPRGRALFECPLVKPGELGGGSFGFYGCRGQITDQSECAVIEFPKSRNYACQYVGKSLLLANEMPGVSRPLYRCPKQYGGTLGGGDWGYYGCEGQLTPERQCKTIEYPKHQTASCSLEGHLPLE